MDKLYNQEAVTSQDMNTEAVRRIRMFGLLPQVESAYLRGQLLCSDRGSMRSLSREELDQIQKLEQEYGFRVYHVIATRMLGFDLLELLYVSKYKEEWEADREDIRTGYIFVYAINQDVPEWSEPGDIVIEMRDGVLNRVG